MDPKLKIGKTLNQPLMQISQSEHNDKQKKLSLHAGSQFNKGDWLGFLMAFQIKKKRVE